MTSLVAGCCVGVAILLNVVGIRGDMARKTAMLGVWAFVILGIGASFWANGKSEYASYTLYGCQFCGYQWTPAPGESRPAPRGADRELAGLGAERLADEERQRQEAARAAWFLEQQRRKK